MRRIARRSAWAVAAWVLTAALGAAEDPAPRGGLRPVAAARDRHRQDSPEWAPPPIEVAPPWVGDGTPSKDRELRLVPPRVKILSIEAIPEPSDWEPAPDQRRK